MIVLEHINTLLCSADAEARRKANDFLMKWQQSIEAWQETHAIMAGGFPLEAKFIAAQTLRVKLMYDFYQLPADSVGKLCEILMAYLGDASLPRNIASTISLAVCDLAIQAIEVWQLPLDSFIAYYNRGGLTLKTLLTLIESLADESRNSRIIVTPDARKKFTENMKREYPKLLEFLVKLRSSGNDVKTSSDIFRSWYSWRKLDNFGENSEASRIFINDCVEIIKRPNARSDLGLDNETYEAAVDCMVDVLQEVNYLTSRIKMEAESSNDSVRYYAQTKQDLQPVVRTCFDLCVSDEFSNFLVEAFGNQDRFLLECFSRLVSSLIESLEFNLIDPQPPLLRLIKLAIQFIEVPYCLAFPRFPTGNQPGTINCFSKYYNRMEVRERALQVVSTCDPGDFTPIDEETSIYAQYAVSIISDILHAESPNCQGAKDIAMQLLEIVLLVATRPASAGELDNREYENYVSDIYYVIPRLVKILHTDYVFDNIQKLTIGHGNFASSVQGLDSSFRVFGATVRHLDINKLSKQQLMLLSSIIDGIEQLLRNKVPTGISDLNCWESAIIFIGKSIRLLMLDDTEVMVQRVTSLLCGAYTAGVGCEAQYASMIERILVSNISSMCYHLRLGKLRNWETILQNLGKCIRKAETNKEFSVMLIEGISRAISDLPPSTICNVAEQLSQEWLQQIDAVVRNGVVIAPGEIVKPVEKICALMRNIKVKNILQKLVREAITPLMCRLLELYYQDENTVEDIGRCLKHTARSIGKDFLPCVPQLVATVENLAKKRLWSTYLYMVEWLYMLSAPEKEPVQRLYGVLTGIALDLLSNNSPKPQIIEDPEQLIDDFFGLQTRFIRNTPGCFDNMAAFRAIVAASVMCFNIRQPSSVFEFWIAFLESDVVFTNFKQVALEFLPQCISEIFAVLGTGCETSVEHCVEDFVDSLCHVMGTDAALLLKVGLEKLPVAVVPNERQKQQILEGLVSDRRKGAIYQIHKLCCQVAMRNRAY